jgi:hypothetical protein
MDEHNLSQMMKMPDDWWCRGTTCEVLLECFSRHLLGLEVVASVNGRTKAEVFSGFLVYIHQQVLWFTAGHVVAYIQRLISDPEIEILVMRWLDLCEVNGAESIPVHNRSLEMFAMPENLLDWGIVRIAGLDLENLVKNKRVQFLEPQIWKNLHLGKPEGYYVLGWPAQDVEVNEKESSVRASMICVPVIKLEYDKCSAEGDFWSDPDAFYGRIMPFSGETEVPPIDIRGMSGGPLLSIERKPDKGFLYRLYGIQRSWEVRQHIIRAESMYKILQIIESEMA